MNKLKLVFVAISTVFAGNTIQAGGLLTNTNQHVAFNRMMSREASIGIDGVYYNPAGVVFMNEGHHLAINCSWLIRPVLLRMIMHCSQIM